ncbi:MAG: magnesium transporter [Mycobacterium sp.]
MRSSAPTSLVGSVAQECENAGRRMLWLSQETGQEVLGSDGRMVGRVADLSVDLDGQAGSRLVGRLLVKRQHAMDLLIPWSAIADFGHSSVLLTERNEESVAAAGSSPDGLRADEILLVRDVLDTQIVDVIGHRLARVADVALTRVAGDRLELVGVEVGFGGVLRRLGLPALAARRRRDVVVWTDLHLTSERGHTVQLGTPLSAVHHLDESGLAALVDRLDVQSAAEVLALSAPRVAAGAVQSANPAVGERVLRAMADQDVAEIVDAMPAHHATRWRARLARTPAHRGRLFLRSRTWPRRRGTTPDRSS